MRKVDEVAQEQSCLNRAQPGEMIFVLLGRDAAAPPAIRAWIEERLPLGKNTPIDREMIDAEMCAQEMESQQRASARAAAGLRAAPQNPDRHLGAVE